MITRFSRSSRAWLVGAGIALMVLTAPSSSAGVVDGVKTVDSVIFYLGVVPAAVVRGHPQGHPETQMHGGVPGRSIHNVHIVIALFEKSTGARITRATAVANIIGARGKRWSVPLRPMTINDSLTFGAYAELGSGEDYGINIQVQRTQPARQRPITAQFTYTHD